MPEFKRIEDLQQLFIMAMVAGDVVIVARIEMEIGILTTLAFERESLRLHA